MKLRQSLIGALMIGLCAGPAQAYYSTPGSGAGTLGSDNSITSQGYGSTPGNGSSLHAPLGTTEMSGGYGGYGGYGGDIGSSSFSDSAASSFFGTDPYGSSGTAGAWNQDFGQNNGRISALDLTAHQSRSSSESGGGSGLTIFSSPFDSDDSDRPAPLNLLGPILIVALAASFVGVLLWIVKMRNSAYS